MNETPALNEPRYSTPAITLFLLAAFLFRLFFGLCSQFWTIEENQVYLVGLKYYATGQWPYFGATAFKAKIPGALLGLTVGLPFNLWPAPEAPIIFLNLLSFGSLCLLAWYCSKRLPRFPRWFLWAWLMTAPWTLNFSTHVVNPSYVLFGGILFFVGFWETIPSLRAGILPQGLCNALMGFAFFWVIQFHLSGVALVPWMLLSFFLQLRRAPRGRPSAWVSSVSASGGRKAPPVCGGARRGAKATALNLRSQLKLAETDHGKGNHVERSGESCDDVQPVMPDLVASR